MDISFLNLPDVPMKLIMEYLDLQSVIFRIKKLEDSENQHQENRRQLLRHVEQRRMLMHQDLQASFQRHRNPVLWIPSLM
ncbi:hypothetical protein L5515_013306 [Caenorhabditis briggsae]|uniref:Uncharacterized protein n=1 Tax=Caenorhabditis briggsae TaxID=6238 RepID=A0AAE9J6H6_CAEBR|nr:hypothetical protein L5515_013306 [Caenorhabditis briggsae]